MVFGGRRLDDISLDGIRLLIENRVLGGPHLDYKETPYSGCAKDRRELLCDVIALANAEGGYLVLGIREDSASRAAELVPFDDPLDVTKAIRQTCLDRIRDHIEGLEVRALETAFNQGIIVIHTPTSDQCPHMSTLDGRTEFCRRYETDKRAMTIGEIREVVQRHGRTQPL